MNRRQIEKKYKRKWQELFADLFADLFAINGVKAKPSRIILDPRGMVRGDNELTMAAQAAGCELILHIKPKGKEEAKDGKSIEV